MKALKDADAGVRKQAAWALGAIGGTRSGSVEAELSCAI